MGIIINLSFIDIILAFYSGLLKKPFLLPTIILLFLRFLNIWIYKKRKDESQNWFLFLPLFFTTYCKKSTRCPQSESKQSPVTLMKMITLSQKESKVHWPIKGHNNLSKCCQLLLSTFLKITQPPILKHPVIFGIAKTKKWIFHMNLYI